MAVPARDGFASFEADVAARNAALSRNAYLVTGDHHLAEDPVQQTPLRVVGTVNSQARDGLGRLRVLAPELGASVETEAGR